MRANDYPLSEEEFQEIYSKVPRLTVEILVLGEQGVYLTMRDIEPCKGLWHIPGGTVRYGEALLEAVERIAKRELGIKVKAADLLGYIEYPTHYQKGLDCPVGIAFAVTKFQGAIGKNNEAQKAGWFSELPEPIHVEQAEFIRQHSILNF